VFQHEGVDAGLGDTWLATALAHRNNQGGWAGEREDIVGDEVVGQDNVGGLQQSECAEG
jgi:hypothetical protein